MPQQQLNAVVSRSIWLPTTESRASLRDQGLARTRMICRSSGQAIASDAAVIAIVLLTAGFDASLASLRRAAES
jgi:hypothetical protein